MSSRTALGFGLALIALGVTIVLGVRGPTAELLEAIGVGLVGVGLYLVAIALREIVGDDG